jgi:hypothetical protein
MTTLFPWLSQPELLLFILDAIAGSWCLWTSRLTRDGGRIVPVTLTTPPPTVVFVNLKPFAALSWFFSMQVLCILDELDTHTV